MSFYGHKQGIISEKGQSFFEGQEVSFIYRKEMRTGSIDVLRVNSAVISIKDILNQKEQNEKTVVNYEKLMAVYN
ncbi:hypothetical protein [Candidatus Enterococcus clewellii]|uniref:Uncharacterized protein n=1 Tax=Candidatus Enterococcus clewellii TaxID=1834193 RepID=A0A242JWW8_9ENTE|nr:hypothetical protein [Enterococcus sp. 9E7_DIV0242]OTP09816.1 hypothetical protein A5888_004012 [Enterococcus sp. 9E7_DIV0242]